MAIDLGYQAEKAGNNVKEFFSSNSIIAHIVFLILVIIVFVLLLRLGTAILSWIFSPKPVLTVSPQLKSGSQQEIIPANPSEKGSRPIMRSQNQMRGIEFTWSIWIYIDSAALQSNRDKFRHVFNKGNTDVKSVDGIVEPNNGPGLYISPNNNPNVAELSLLVRMNVFTNESQGNPLTQLNTACLQAVNAYKQQNKMGLSQSQLQNAAGAMFADTMIDTMSAAVGQGNQLQAMNELNTLGGREQALISGNQGLQTEQDLMNKCKQEWQYLNNTQATQGKGSLPLAPTIYDDIEIPEIPINKWVSVIIRCENNNILDVYINGRLLRRHRLSGVARQNYGSTNLSLGGGFPGYRSDLKYFNYAIGTAEIDWIVENGPDLNAEGSDLGTSKPYYLANRWFNDNMDPVYGGGM